MLGPVKKLGERARRWALAVLERLAAHTKDLLLVAGVVAILGGVALYSQAAALVVGGVAAIALSVLWHLGEK